MGRTAYLSSAAAGLSRVRPVSLVVQVIVTGLAAGGVYGLLAVGYSLIYRLTGVVYFAFGDLVAFAVFATLLVAAGTAPVSQTSLAPGRFLLALVVALAACIGLGAATYVLFIEPYLLRGSTLGWVAATLAIAFALRGMIGATFTRPAYVFPDPIPFDRIGHDGLVTIAGASVQVRSFFVIALAAALAALAAWTLERTRYGRALQAISSDVEGARFVGLPVEGLVALTFGLVGGLAALAAVAAAPSAPVLRRHGHVARAERPRRRADRPVRISMGGLCRGPRRRPRRGGDRQPPHRRLRARAPVRRDPSAGRSPLGLIAYRSLRSDDGVRSRMSTTVFEQTARALAAAGRDIRAGWTLRTTLTVLAIAAALIAPSVLPLSGRMPDLAAFVYLAVAAVGLAYAVGLAGIPSLGQGAFLGVGAFAEAIARAKGGWPLLPSLLLAVVAATAAGVLTGLATGRLRGAFVAASTWILSWIVALALMSFPGISGGAQGLVLPEANLFSAGR